MIDHNRFLQNKIFSRSFIFLILMMLYLFVMFSNSWQPPWEEAEVIHTVSKNDGNLEEIWVQPNVYTRGEGVTAAQGLFFILASLEQNEGYKLLAFEGSSGKLRWSIPDKSSLTTLSATSSALYVADLHGPIVAAHDLFTGEILWSSPPLPSRSVVTLYVAGDLIYASSAHDIHHLLRADTGEVLQTFKQIPTAATLQTLQKKTELFAPTTQLKPEYFQEGDLFTEDIKFIWKQGGKISAIDRHTEHTLWQTEERVVSNVVPTKSVVYLLTIEGKLLGLNPQNGAIVTSIQFTPSPFITIDSQSHSRAYRIAVDEGAGLLYVLLGDSRQLFAFSIVHS